MNFVEECKLYETMWEIPTLPFSVQELKDALDKTNSLELGYNFEDKDLKTINYEPYSATRWVVDKNTDNTYSLTGWITDEKGGEVEGNSWSFSKIEDVYKAISARMPLEDLIDLKEVAVETEENLTEDATNDTAAAYALLTKMGEVEIEFPEFEREWFKDRADARGQHRQDYGTDVYPAFTYNVDATDVFDNLRDTIIPKYKDKVEKSDLLAQYLKLDQASEDGSTETANALDFFLAQHLEDFIEIFNKALIERYEEEAQKWALENLEPEDPADYWLD